MILEFGNDLDVSTLEVGKECILSFNFNGNPYTINRAFIKSIDIKNNSACIEPLADKSEESTFKDIYTKNITMQLFDKSNGEKIMSYKI